MHIMHSKDLSSLSEARNHTDKHLINSDDTETTLLMNQLHISLDGIGGQSNTTGAITLPSNRGEP